MKEFARESLESELQSLRRELRKGAQGDANVDALLSSMRRYFQYPESSPAPAAAKEEQIIALVWMVARTIVQTHNPRTHDSAETLLQAADDYIAARRLFC